MEKIYLSIVASLLTLCSFAQVSENQKMVELGKAYNDYMFRNTPTNEYVNELTDDVPQNLQFASKFIVQTIRVKNKLLSLEYLRRPEDWVMKQLYIIRQISYNLKAENRVPEEMLIDSLMKKDIQVNELIENYYSMIFVGVGNKNQPFNLSKVDFKLKEYQLKDETEKGIFVLSAMDLCGMNIWGYMNVVKPPNTKKAYANIKKFPKINGSPYYQYTDFYFKDFEMVIIKDKSAQSYKTYYINKFYDTLLSHLNCLNSEGGSEKQIRDLMLGSILKERSLYKYSKKRQQLESLFSTQNMD
jgi:hypothetical protein